LAGGVGLIVYLSFPVAPPRLIPGGGFVDTLRDVFALQYDNSSLINEFAAVPSLHQGFALIMGGAFYRIMGGRAGMAVFAILPAIMFVSIVVTANHWFIDAILGAMVALLAMWAASKLERHGDRWFAPVGRFKMRLYGSVMDRMPGTGHLGAPQS
jgi:membrane-associated phospholipid phosphatase